MRIKLQPAFVLHSRPYRDSSQILDILTPEFGRLSLVARSSRRRQSGGSIASILQPFIPLLLSFSGRAEMKSLTAAETAGSPLTPRGARLFSAFYINELLVRLLHQHDPHPTLFVAYSDALHALTDTAQVDEGLRRFELKLLQELGFGFELAVDGRSGQAIIAEHWYCFDAEYGLVLQEPATVSKQPAFPGNEILAMAGGEFGGAVKGTAKRLLRLALANHLGDKPLKSRDLFRRSQYNRVPDQGRGDAL